MLPPLCVVSLFKVLLSEVFTHSGVEIIDQYLSLPVASRVRLELSLGPGDVDVHRVQIQEFMVETTLDTRMGRNDVLLKHQRCLDDRCDSSSLD